MLLDANVLLYAVDSSARQHEKCSSWLLGAMVGQHRVAVPWQTIGAFLRIATHPRVFARPLTADDAWSIMQQWLSAPTCWIPEATHRTARILGELITTLDLRGNLVTDAQMAALALEHGIGVVSVDSDFARFPGLRWINPLST